VTRSRDARTLDFVSLLLERRGARRVSRAPADRDLSPGFGPKRLCPSCAHPLNEHGADGECWLVDLHGRRLCWCGAVDDDELPAWVAELLLPVSPSSSLPVCCQTADRVTTQDHRS
jgi:hypothetical protein